MAADVPVQYVLHVNSLCSLTTART